MRKLTILFALLTLSVGLIQADIIYHQKSEPTCEQRGFTQDCWEDTQTGAIYADQSCDQELNSAEVIRYAKFVVSPISYLDTYTEKEDATYAGVPFYWAAERGFGFAAPVQTEAYAMKFTVRDDNPTYARIKWYKSETNNDDYEENFYFYVYVNEQEVLGIVIKNKSALFSAPLNGLKKGDIIEIKVRRSGTDLDGSTTVAAALEYCSPHCGAVSDITITPTASSFRKAQGTADPEFSYKVEGNIFPSIPLQGITVTRAEGEDPGTYTVTASCPEGANPNYNIHFNTATFTIANTTYHKAFPAPDCQTLGWAKDCWEDLDKQTFYTDALLTQNITLHDAIQYPDLVTQCFTATSGSWYRYIGTSATTEVGKGGETINGTFYVYGRNITNARLKIESINYSSMPPNILDDVQGTYEYGETSGEWRLNPAEQFRYIDLPNLKYGDEVQISCQPINTDGVLGGIPFTFTLEYLSDNCGDIALPLSVTGTPTVSDKQWDGTTHVEPSAINLSECQLVGLEAEDEGKVQLTATAVYDNAEVGDNHTVTVTYGLSVTDEALAGKYKFYGSDKTTTVSNVAIHPATTPVKYLDANGQEQTADAIEVVNADEQVTWGKEGKTVWYVVNDEDVTLSKGAICQGNVRLILADGAKLTATGIEEIHDDNNTPAIQVSGEGNSFTIYGQTAQTGQLIATSKTYAAGIGGGYNQSGDNITIHGGKVTATGGKSAAGIGGGGGGSGNKITIHGGKVTATGGEDGAGIGGGAGGSYSNITITDGEIIATGGNKAAGIGVGFGSRGGSDITISGGTITATGGNGASGIGCGYGVALGIKNIFAATNCIVKAGTSETLTDEDIVEHDSETDLTSSLNGKRYVEIETVWLVPYLDENGELKTVADPTIVTDASSIVYWDAGWYVVMGDVTLAQGADCSGAIHLILADGAKLTATGRVGDAWEMGFPGAPGIRVVGENKSFTVYAQSTDPTTMGQLIARGGWLAAGIGGGEHGNASNITINGGTIVANGGDDGAGIGGGQMGSCTNIHINGGQVRASSIDFCASGIGGGCSEDFPMSGKDIYVSTNLIIKAGDNDPSTVIENGGGDLAGKLKGKRYVTIEMPAKGNLTAADLVVSNTSATYDGTPKAATVALIDGITGAGEITVTYKQGETVVASPTNVGKYDIYAAVAEGTKYNAFPETQVGTLTIANPIDEWFTLRTDVTPDNWNTICMENNITAIEGATFWNVVAERTDEFELEQVFEPQAGYGYIIYYTATELKVKYGNETADVPVTATEQNPIQGIYEAITTYDQEGKNALKGNYVVYNNELCKVTGWVTMADHRAYVKAETAPNTAPAIARGPRMTMAKPNSTPTSLGGEADRRRGGKAMKVIENGQFRIVRDNKMYNVLGVGEYH